MRPHCLSVIVVAVLGCCTGVSAQTGDFESLAAGADLSGWVNVIGAESTWTARDEFIRGTGAPQSVLRTREQYENYILAFDYRSAPSGRAGVILHSDALPAPGIPWPRGINIDLKAPGDSGVITGIAGAMVEPVTGSSDDRPNSSPTDGWNRCTVESRDGHIAVKINGTTVETANYASPRKGYIALKSDGSEVFFRDIGLQKLASTHPAAYEVATSDTGFVSLYNGHELSEHWEMKSGHRGHWTARDWVIDYDGNSREDDKNLWTTKVYGDFVLIADMRFTRQPAPDSLPVVLPDGSEAIAQDGNTKMVEVQYAGDTGIYVRGSSKNQINMGNRYIGSGEIYGYRVDEDMPPEVRRSVVPRVKADHPPGEWNRYIVTMKDDRITVELNGRVVIDDARLPGVAEEGKIALQDDHASGNRFQFGNLYLKTLD